MSYDKPRDNGIDSLKSISVFLVIYIHLSISFLFIHERNVLFYLLTLTNSVARFAVPLLLFLSGIVLGSKYVGKINIIDFYKKRMSKIIFPYLLACIIFFMYQGFSLVDEFGRFILGTLTGDIYYHLWFVPTILILYAVFPIIIYIQRKVPDGKRLLFILPIVLLATISPLFTTRGYYIFFPVSLTFFALGVICAPIKEKLFKTNSRTLFLGLVIPFLFFLEYVRYKYGLSTGQYYGRPIIIKMIEYFSNSIFDILVIFLLIKQRHIIDKFIGKYRLARVVGKLSFEIYLIHALYLDIFSNYLIARNLEPNNFMFYLICLLTTLLCSLFTVAIYKFIHDQLLRAGKTVLQNKHKIA